MYIGRTGRTLQHHVKEHKRKVRLMDTNLSAVAHHAIEKNHEIDWENAIVIDHQQDLYKRYYSESWQIKVSEQVMNRDFGLLPSVYSCL